MLEAVTRNLFAIIKSIPEGSVCTYGRTAQMAGQPNVARQVARIKHRISFCYGCFLKRMD